MFDFERALLGTIPLDFAAEAWFSVKYAAIGDPPDTTGAVEGRFPVPVAQVLEGLAEMVKHKLTLLYAYSVYAQTIRGPARGELSDLFQELAEEDLEGVEYYLKRMASLGGGAHLPDISSPPAVTNPEDAVKVLLRLEQEAVAKLSALKALVGENPMKYEIEASMAEEQEHVDVLWQHLEHEATPERMVEQDAPIEEKIAFMRMRFWKMAEGLSKSELKELKKQQEDADELRGMLVAKHNPDAESWVKKKKTIGTASGGAKGTLAGALLGAAGGAITRKSRPLIAAMGVAGGTTGGLLGGATGKELAGAKAYRTVAKVSAVRMKNAIKLAFENMAQGDPSLAAARTEDIETEEAGPMQSDDTQYRSSEGPVIDPALSEYIENEQEAADIEEQSSAEYFKSIAQEATQKADATGAQLQQIQQELQMQQQQMAQLNQQVQVTQQQAQQVQDTAMQTASMAQSTAANSQSQAIKAMQDVIMHKQLAANMRQGVLQMKDQLQQVLMSDPTQGVENQLQPAPVMPVMPPGAPGPGDVPPSPDQAGAPLPPDPAGGQPISPEQKQASVARKMLEVAKKKAPYTVPGAVVGGGATYAAIRGGSTDKLKEEVDEMSRRSNAGETSSSEESRLAKDKMRLAYSEFADKNPRAAIAAGAGVGAGAAAAAGPPLKSLGSYVYKAVKNRPR